VKFQASILDLSCKSISKPFNAMTKKSLQPQLRLRFLKAYCIYMLRMYTNTARSIRSATSSSFRGGSIFINFHSITSSCLFNGGTTSSQTVTDIVIFATFPKMRTY